LSTENLPDEHDHGRLAGLELLAQPLHEVVVDPGVAHGATCGSAAAHRGRQDHELRVPWELGDGLVGCTLGTDCGVAGIELTLEHRRGGLIRAEVRGGPFGERLLAVQRPAYEPAHRAEFARARRCEGPVAFADEGLCVRSGHTLPVDTRVPEAA
jgi:hypothetical protein